MTQNNKVLPKPAIKALVEKLLELENLEEIVDILNRYIKMSAKKKNN